MPASLKLAEEHEDDLNVLFVERQGLSTDAAAGFALRKKWLGTGAMWTGEAPFTTGGRGLPSFALLSADGRVLLTGNPVAAESEIEERIDAELAGMRKGPESAPRSVKSAWGDFAKGKYSQALAAARKAAGSGGEDAEAAREALETFERRLKSRIDRIERMIESGHYLEAQDRAEELAKSLKGVEELAVRLDELRARLASGELKEEVAAAKSLSRIECKLYAEGPEPRIVKELEQFAQAKDGTKAADRARRLAALAAES